jgi:hypothetical protein
MGGSRAKKGPIIAAGQARNPADQRLSSPTNVVTLLGGNMAMIRIIPMPA